MAMRSSRCPGPRNPSRRLTAFIAGAALAAANLDVWAAGVGPDRFFSIIGYLSAYQDVKAAGLDPRDHYNQFGWKEGRDPGGDFDTSFYLIHNPDVARANMNPLEHYLQFGRVEGRPILPAVGFPGQITSTDFDPQFYLLSNTDVAAAGVNPSDHFFIYGWKEGRDPNGLFNTRFYLSQNPDVAVSGMNPLLHYGEFGWKEGRDPSAQFSTSGYLAANPDVAAAGMNPLDHFLRYGLYEGRLPITMLDLHPYMASSLTCDGNPGTPLRQADPVTCARVDYGSLGNPYWMATVTMRAVVSGEDGAITTWSYIPLGSFVDPLKRGTCIPQTDLRCADGGEAYALRGDWLVATRTQDNGQPGVVHEFPRPWVLATRQTIACDQGWTIYNADERGCTAVIDWPHIGPVHTIVSEHGTVELVERIFLAKGWGRLHWQAFSKKPIVPDLPERCPDVGGWNAPPSNQPHLRLTDCRLAVRVVPLDWGLTGAQLWHP